MSQPWIVEVPLDKLDPSKDYFVARRWLDSNKRPCYEFYSRLLNGKDTWSGKPGIAIRYPGKPELKAAILKNSHVELIAVEVPSDADKRWRARKRRIR